MSAAPDRRALAREVVRLAWPAIVQGLLHTVVFLADRLMLGRYDAEALASMQISGPLLWSVFSITLAFSAGTVAVVGRAVGARDPVRARAATRAVIGLAFAAGVVVGLLGFLGRGVIADALAGGPATSESVRGMARTYLAILFPVSPLYFMGMIGTTVLQASGDTRTPMRIAVFAELLNVLGNWVFIYGHLGMPELGIVGAAGASAFAFVFNAAAILWVLRRNRGPVALAPVVPEPGAVVGAAVGAAPGGGAVTAADAATAATRDAAVRRDALKAVLRVSRAAFGEKLIFHGGFLVFVALIGRLGDVAMAANQSLIALESVGFIGAAGFGVAAGALVSQKLGAGRPDEAAASGWLATGVGIAALSLVSVVFLVFPEALVSLFTEEPEIVALGARCLRVAALAQPLMAISDALASALRGAGDTTNPMIAALVGPVVVRVAATWFFAFELELGLFGVWIGSTLDWAVRSVWLAVVFRRGRWRLIRV